MIKSILLLDVPLWKRTRLVCMHIQPPCCNINTKLDNCPHKDVLIVTAFFKDRYVIGVLVASRLAKLFTLQPS